MLKQPNWEEINAYVDGELPAGRAAEIAEATAHDRGLARQIAVVTRLRADLQASLAPPDPSQLVPDVMTGTTQGGHNALRLTAACLLALS